MYWFIIFHSFGGGGGITTSIVGSIFFTSDELFWMEQLPIGRAIGASSHLIC